MPPSQESIAAEKRNVALISVLAAACITLLKLIVGRAANSLGVLSEAAHSGLDLIASLLTAVSIRLAARPADHDHPYGHGKFENVSAFAQIFFMLLSAGWILVEAIQRTLHHTDTLDLSVWPFLVLLLSIAVDYTRSNTLERTAARHNSPALHADAVHFRTDMLTGAGVIAGLICVAVGRELHIQALSYADSAAAVLVAAVILYAAWNLARPTLAQLTDAVPEEEQLRVLTQLRLLPGVLSVDRLRIRRSGAKYFADLTVGMARTLTFQRVEDLTRNITQAVQRVLPEADVVVHTVPRAPRNESIFDRVHAVAARHNIAVHDLAVRDDGNGRLSVEQHIEVPEQMTLRSAHDFVTTLEADVRADCPEITGILTHIESAPEAVAAGDSVRLAQSLEHLLRDSARKDPEIVDVHDVSARRVDDRIQMACHCTLPDDLPMVRVHAIITAVEARVRVAAPEVSRVLIHPEPATDNRR